MTDLRRLLLVPSCAAITCLLFACASTTTDGGASSGASTSSSSGGTTSGTSTSSGSTDEGSSSAGATSTKSRLQQLCAGWCGGEDACAADAKNACYAALASEANLAELESCGAEGKCGVESCGIGSSAASSFLTACKSKVSACGGSIDGIRAGDCGDVIPLFRDEVIADLKSCMSEACADVVACMQSATRSADPACASL